MYDALNHGARRVCAGRWRRCRCPGPGRAGRIVLAVDVTPRCARTLHPAQTGCFATSTAAGRGQAQSIPGWLYSFVAAIEPGWTSWSALLDAIRLDPAEDATALTAEQLRGQPASPPRRRSRPRPRRSRPRPRRSRRRARSPTATRSGAPTPLPARRRTARRVTRATSTRRRPSHLAHPGPQWRLLDGHERPFGLLVRPPLLVVMTCWPPYDVHPSGRSYMPVVRVCSSAASQR